jgi:hypothetical protein
VNHGRILATVSMCRRGPAREIPIHLRRVLAIWPAAAFRESQRLTCIGSFGTRAFRHYRVFPVPPNGSRCKLRGRSACRSRSGMAVAAEEFDERLATCNGRDAVHPGDDVGSSAAGPATGRDSFTPKLDRGPASVPPHSLSCTYRSRR